MTPKQILDSFSETLMRDERILTARERALLATLLQHAKSATGENHETQEAVRSVIASAIGETIAQRAFAVLGGSIVERILEGSSPTTEMLERPIEVMGPKGPQPPGANEPQPPGVKAPHKEPHPHHPAKEEPTPPGPQPPGTKPPGPQPPGTPLKTPGIVPPGGGDLRAASARPFHRHPVPARSGK